MKEGDVVTALLPQAIGGFKKRPVVVLREMPKYGDLLVCGVSTQLHQYLKGFDELILRDSSDFKSSGLVNESVIRLGYLSSVPQKDIEGVIGSVSRKRHKRLLKALSNYLVRKK